jgi:hypothetical protein
MDVVDIKADFDEVAVERAAAVEASFGAPIGAKRRCDITAPPLQSQPGLEDLLGDLRHARSRGDLGRLALLLYCEVRRWARLAGEQELAEHASELITRCPRASREEFLTQVDDLIIELDKARLQHG